MRGIATTNASLLAFPSNFLLLLVFFLARKHREDQRENLVISTKGNIRQTTKALCFYLLLNEDGGGRKE